MAENVRVTLKGGGGFEVPWLVIDGDTVEAVKATTAESVGLTAESVADATLAEVVVEANAAFAAIQTAKSGLGASAVPARRQGGRGGKQNPSPSDNEAKTAPESETEVNEAGNNAAVIAQIEKARTPDALKKIWARNKDAFGNDEVMTAYKNRGKQLTGGK